MRKLKIISCCLIMIVCFPCFLIAQHADSLFLNRADILFSEQTDLTDRWNDGEADVEDEISAYKKMDINKCSANDFVKLGLAKEQAENLIRYRKQGGIRDMHELQAVPGLDEICLRKLRRYTKVNPRQILPKDLIQDLSRGKSVLNLRADFYQTNGIDYTKYLPEYATSFMQSVRTRIKYVHSGSYLDFSLVGEKDAGETFRWIKKQRGMDVYMGNLRYRGNGVVKQMIFGDYKVSMGQGLIIWQGFGGGLGTIGMMGRSQKEIFSLHRSYNEFYFKRGVAAELQCGDWQVGVFLSKRRLDASLQWDSIEQIRKIRAIYNTGLHADSLSNQRRNTVTEYSVGCRTVFHRSYGYLGFNAVGYDYGMSFYKNAELYSFYSPDEQKRLYASTDYSLAYHNLHFFGEVASMNLRSVAMQHNLSLSLNKEMEIGLGYRDYNPAFRSADAMVIGLLSYPSNERGYVIQGKYNLNRDTEIWVYWDVSSSKWLKYGEIQPLRSSTLMFSCIKFDKLGNGLGFRYRRNVISNLNGMDELTILNRDKIANTYDFHARIKFGKNKGLFFRYVYREAVEMDNHLSAGLFCWGLDAKWPKDFSIQWRMYVMEGVSSAGGIIVQEADLSGSQQIRWMYGNKTAFSCLIHKTWNKWLKLGVKGQVVTNGSINSFFENNVSDKIFSINTSFLF